MPSSLANREKAICLGVDPFWSSLAMFVTQDLVLRQYFSERIILGADNLPKNGPVVLAPTHRSRWDALMLPMAAGRRVTSRDCRFMVTRSEMKGLQGWFLNRLGCFPVDQAKPSLTSLRYAIDLMVEGEQLVVFPEGKINRKGEKINLFEGLARLALLAAKKGVEIKIVPVGLGYSEILPKPYGKAAICFAQAISFNCFSKEGIKAFNLDLSNNMNAAEKAALQAVGRKKFFP